MSRRGGGFTDLIEACEIFRKYDDSYAPTHCEHDVITVCGIDPADVSDEDKQRLLELGWHVSDEYGEDQFHSFRFGSA